MVAGRNASEAFALLLPLDFKFENNAKKDTGNTTILNKAYQVLHNTLCSIRFFRILAAGLQQFIIDITQTSRYRKRGGFAVVHI